MSNDNLITLLKEARARIDEVIAQLKPDASERKSRTAAPKTQTQATTPSSTISFHKSALAFMKDYSRAVKGPQKFALLVAWSVKGNTKTEVSYQSVKAQWNKMKTVLGSEFNPANCNRAKAAGWVDTPKHGVYVLCDSWTECLERK
jgi:hypothetical protein